MDPQTTRKIQRRLLKKTQQRLNRLLRLLMRSHLSKRASSDTNDALDELLSRSVANSMFTNGFSVGPFGLTSPVPESVPSESASASTLTSESPAEIQESEMTDICSGKLFL